MDKEYRFLGGQPPKESFPVEGLVEASTKVLRRMGQELAFYPTFSDWAGKSNKGYLGLREVASERYRHREDIALPVENISITTGSMDAIVLLGRALTQPGDTVITEELTYMGTLNCFRYLRMNIEGVPVDPVKGMEVDALEKTLKRLKAMNVKPKFIYTIPNYQNPTGAILPLDRRKRMLDLAYEYDTTILQDDCYGDLDFEGGVPPSLYTLEKLEKKGERVVFIATFSKILGTGVRQGYLYAPPKIMDLVNANRWDAGASALASFIVAEFFKDNLRSHLKEHVAVIKAKRDALMKAVEENLTGIATWNKPKGGLFFWMKLPDAIDMDKLQAEANARKVYYSRGREFHVRNEDIKYLRLAYTHMTHDEIREGVEQLGKAIRAALGKK
jgi:2-aminoadipate transaminase